jgi:hypothetical protein
MMNMKAYLLKMPVSLNATSPSLPGPGSNRQPVKDLKPSSAIQEIRIHSGAAGMF